MNGNQSMPIATGTIPAIAPITVTTQITSSVLASPAFERSPNGELR